MKLLYRERPLPESSILKYSATLKEDSDTSAFLWIHKFLKKHMLLQNALGHCFCSLKNHSEILEKSLQNLPLECCYINLKAPAKKLVLVRFQTCVGNSPF